MVWLLAIFFVPWIAVVGDRVLLFERLPAPVHWVIQLLGVMIGAAAMAWAWRSRKGARPRVYLVVSFASIIWWQAAIFLCDAIYFDVSRAVIARWGTLGLFGMGLAWFIWLVDKKAKQLRQRSLDALAELPVAAKHLVIQPTWIWNPLNLDAWYYGRRAKKLNQSLGAFTAYSLAFFLTFLILSQMQGCQEVYEMPAGGGEQQQIVQTIQVKKIIRKRFVVNPYSAVSFKVPDIKDVVQLDFDKLTEHQYTIGYGQGEGAGFAGGTSRGKVGFIRLEYSGGDWDQDFGIGGDDNMLAEYGIRTQHKVAKRSESRRVVQLKNFKQGAAPPLVYMTGQKNISLSNSEIKILRKYLMEQRGMIFADNGGSRHWENQFFALMNKVLPDVRRVPIERDDVIHKIPYPIPSLPIVAPHGSRRDAATGWYKDGRWLCYYHPGDIGDAWSDGHAGVKPEIWEACYRLGTNIIFYAHLEYDKWRQTQNKKKS